MRWRGVGGWGGGGGGGGGFGGERRRWRPLEEGFWGFCLSGERDGKSEGFNGRRGL